MKFERNTVSVKKLEKVEVKFFGFILYWYWKCELTVTFHKKVLLKKSIVVLPDGTVKEEGLEGIKKTISYYGWIPAPKAPKEQVRNEIKYLFV